MPPSTSYPASARLREGLALLWFPSAGERTAPSPSSHSPERYDPAIPCLPFHFRVADTSPCSPPLAAGQATLCAGVTEAHTSLHWRDPYRRIPPPGSRESSAPARTPYSGGLASVASLPERPQVRHPPGVHGRRPDAPLHLTRDWMAKRNGHPPDGAVTDVEAVLQGSDRLAVVGVERGEGGITTHSTCGAGLQGCTVVRRWDC